MIHETQEATEQVAVFGFTTAKNIVGQALKENKNLQHNIDIDESNLPSGFTNLDKETRGFKKGELISFAVRPGNGKTALLLSMVNNLAVKQNKHIALFSPERSAEKIINRLIESETGMSINKIVNGSLKEGDKERALGQIKQIGSADIFIDDSKSLDAKELMLRCHHIKSTAKVDAILIDAIEMYSSHIHDNEIRNLEFESMVNTLNIIAKELDIPVICFTQLNQPVSASNGGLTPCMKELPTFVCEKSATILFLHRPEYYNASQEELPKGIVELIISKLNGKHTEKTAQLRFIESIDRFIDTE